MAGIITKSPVAAYVRTTSLIPASGDMTVMGWINLTAVAPSSQLGTIFYWGDNPATLYNDYVWIGFNENGQIYMDVGGNTGSGLPTASPIGCHHWAYTRSGNAHTFYIDGTSVQTIASLNVTGYSITHQYLGSDTLAAGTNPHETSYFRSWTVALTGPEVISERDSTTPVKASEKTDTPLAVDLNDDSGNGNHWTQYTNEPAFTTDPTNISAVLATDIDPISLTTLKTVRQYCHYNGTTRTVWFKFTALGNTSVVHVFGFGDVNSLYAPVVKPYIGPDTAPVRVLNIGNTNKAITFPTSPGTVYYIEFAPNSGNPIGACLLLEVIHHDPDASVPAGSIMVPDDTSGFPASFISGVDADDNNILSFQQNFPHGEQGDVVPAGVGAGASRYLVEDAGNHGILRLYNADGTLNSSPVIPGATGAVKIRNQQDTGNFWVGYPGQGLTDAFALSVTSSGVVSGTTYTFADAGLTALAANVAETILYYSGQLSSLNSEIKRWDLTLDSAMSDLVADFGGTFRVFDILVMADDSLIVGYYQSIDGTVTIVHYSAAGATLHTYSLGSGASTGPTPHLAYSQLNNSTTFWVWIHNGTTGVSTFREITIATGATNREIESQEYEVGSYQGAVTATPTSRFGNSFSCPFFITRASQSPSQPNGGGGSVVGGLYQVVPRPDTKKTDDTLWVNFPSTTEAVKKPNPTAQTGDIGE